MSSGTSGLTVDLVDVFPCSDLKRRQSGNKIFQCSSPPSINTQTFPPHTSLPAPATPPHSTACSICQELPSAPLPDTTLSSYVAVPLGNTYVHECVRQEAPVSLFWLTQEPTCPLWHGQCLTEAHAPALARPVVSL